MYLKIASRTSILALEQVKEAIEYLRYKLKININYDIVGTKTLGDRVQNLEVHKLKVRGAFSSEVNKRVLRAEADIAVHSLKDLPSKLPNGLEILTVTPRIDPRDSLVAKRNVPLWPTHDSIIAAGSPRRQAFAKILFGESINIIGIRGNIDTRLRKLESGYATHVIIAEAALRRLRVERERLRLPVIPFTPAPGQGYVAIVGFPDTSLGRKILASYSEKDRLVVDAEREFLRRIGGSCGKPIGGIVWTFEKRMGFLIGTAESKEKVMWKFFPATGDSLIDAAKEAARAIGGV